MILLKLFFEFFLIGAFTFGGGYAMIPLIRQVVLEQGWITEELFLDFIAVAESTPGPIAINMATFIGATQAGILGSIIATLGVVLPSFLIILLVASIFIYVLKNKYVKAFLDGIKPVIVGLIISTGLILLFKAIGYQSLTVFNYQPQLLVMLAILLSVYYGHKLLFKRKINSILFILLSASMGITTFMMWEIFA